MNGRPERERAPRPRHDATATDPATARPADPTENESQTADVDALRAALQDCESKFVRLSADFENVRRRSAQESIERTRYASEEAARALLPVLDNLKRAVEHAPEGGAEDLFVNGLHLVVREFETALERLGVQHIPSIGERFDPAVHEAIGGTESDDVDRDTVVEELVPGYRLHDRLLRPALVKVAHPRHRSAVD
jgi:molecular chaperone GrpE